MLRRGRRMVSLTPENICIDILSALITDVVSICSQQKHKNVDLISSPSEISDTDEEIFPTLKKSRLDKDDNITMNTTDIVNQLASSMDMLLDQNMLDILNPLVDVSMKGLEAEIDHGNAVDTIPSKNIAESGIDFNNIVDGNENNVVEGTLISISDPSVVIENNNELNEINSMSEHNKSNALVESVENVLEGNEINIMRGPNDVYGVVDSVANVLEVNEINIMPERNEGSSFAESISNVVDDIESNTVSECSNTRQNINDVNEFWHKQNISGGKKRKPRKSEKESRQQRKERSHLRNTGQAYSTTSGKAIRARSIKELNDCRLKCKERIPDDLRKHFYSYYWTLGGYDDRIDFVKNLIEPSKKKTEKICATKIRNRTFSNKYFLTFAGESFPICRGCLAKTLDETSKFIQIATTKKQIATGYITTEKKRRGGIKKISVQKLQEVKEHILSFPAYESHYARSQTKKKFLPSDLNVATMYRLYKDKCQDKPVCLTTYTQIFKSEDISFKKPKVDTCGTCDTLIAKIKVAEKDNNLATKSDLENQLTTHQTLADRAYKEKDADKERAANNNDMMVATFDLQQCLPTPLLSSGLAFYKRQLWTYNLTIHVCNSNKVYCYMWHEASGARGGNQIASCVYHFINNIVESHMKHIIFYSDSCGGQNKNNHVVAMFLTAIKSSANLKIIEHKFLVPGHTHLECDADHALIEKAKRNTTTDIHVPRDWYQLVRSVSKKNSIQVIEMTHVSFFNFSLLLKTEFTARKVNEKKEKLLFTEVRDFKYQKDLFPKVLYRKRELDETDYETIDYTKWGRKTYNEQIQLTPCYTEPLPISAEKLKDIKSLFNYIDHSAQEFYSSLQADPNIAVIDPDLRDRANDNE